MEESLNPIEEITKDFLMDIQRLVVKEETKVYLEEELLMSQELYYLMLV